MLRHGHTGSCQEEVIIYTKIQHWETNMFKWTTSERSCKNNFRFLATFFTSGKYDVEIKIYRWKWVNYWVRTKCFFSGFLLFLLFLSFSEVSIKTALNYDIWINLHHRIVRGYWQGILYWQGLIDNSDYLLLYISPSFPETSLLYNPIIITKYCQGKSSSIISW